MVPRSSVDDVLDHLDRSRWDQPSIRERMQSDHRFAPATRSSRARGKHLNSTAELQLDEAPDTKLSTPALEGMLRAKYTRDKYALIFDVPDAVSLDQRRRIDALAFGCWASLGRSLEGFELKVSRADWLRELKQVDKADPFVALCDRFWLVTSDSSVAKMEEIPACWGWMAATKGGLRIQRPASKLPGCGDAFPRGFVIGVMRRLQDDLLTSPDVAAHIEHKVKEIQDRQKSEVEWASKRARDALERNQAAIKEFEEASGIPFSGYNMGDIGFIVGQLRKLGYGADGGLKTVSRMLEGQENSLRITLEQIRKVRTAIDGQPESAREVPNGD